MYAFGNVHSELDTIVAECSSGRSAIYGCATVAAEDARRLSACASPRGAESEYVALVCGIEGLEGSATGASMSMDIVKPVCFNMDRIWKVNTVNLSVEYACRITDLEWRAFYNK